MKFDDEICKGVSCPECSFNKMEDGCLLAKRLDEIEITPKPCEDAVPRTSVEYICRKNTVSTNPYEHKYHDKFMQFMDDPEISDFGRWQHSNGFNTALVAVKCDLDRVPSAQPESAKRTAEEVQNVSDSDLISRKAAIDELRTCYDTDRKDFTNGDEYINYEQAVCLIERLPSAHPEHRWIPVTVRLPKDYEDVLVWYEYFKYGEYNRMVQTCDVGYYISEFNRWGGGVTGQKVRAIAWMPLPEPPKEVDHETD